MDDFSSKQQKQPEDEERFCLRHTSTSAFGSSYKRAEKKAVGIRLRPGEQGDGDGEGYWQEEYSNPNTPAQYALTRIRGSSNGKDKGVGFFAQPTPSMPMRRIDMEEAEMTFSAQTKAKGSDKAGKRQAKTKTKAMSDDEAEIDFSKRAKSSSEDEEVQRPHPRKATKPVPRMRKKKLSSDEEKPIKLAKGQLASEDEEEWNDHSPVKGDKQTKSKAASRKQQQKRAPSPVPSPSPPTRRPRTRAGGKPTAKRYVPEDESSDSGSVYSDQGSASSSSSSAVGSDSSASAASSSSDGNRGKQRKKVKAFSLFNAKQHYASDDEEEVVDYDYHEPKKRRSTKKASDTTPSKMKFFHDLDKSSNKKEAKTKQKATPRSPRKEMYFQAEDEDQQDGSDQEEDQQDFVYCSICDRMFAPEDFSNAALRTQGPKYCRRHTMSAIKMHQTEAMDMVKQTLEESDGDDEDEGQLRRKGRKKLVLLEDDDL